MKTTDLPVLATRQPAVAASHLALGLWIRGSIVGAAVALAGVASLLAQPRALSVLVALTWIAAGGTFGWLSWQRASALLNGIEGEERGDASKSPAKGDFTLTRQGA